MCEHVGRSCCCAEQYSSVQSVWGRPEAVLLLLQAAELGRQPVALVLPLLLLAPPLIPGSVQLALEATVSPLHLSHLQSNSNTFICLSY